MGGAISVLYVFVNGRPVGLSKDSRLPAEFDITEYVKLGANTLACAVVKWSDASYVEDQDQWWHGGHPPRGLRLRNRLDVDRRRAGATLEPSEGGAARST